MSHFQIAETATPIIGLRERGGPAIEPGGPPADRAEVGAEIDSLAAELAALNRATTVDLRTQWRRLYRADPPKKLSRDLLELGVAWKLQERVLGGLSAVTKRQLVQLAQKLDGRSDLAKARKVSLKPGARLLRTWAGETHEIVVAEDGFVWRGRTWRSLSAIAREMTGTRWSGPRFFGIATAPVSLDQDVEGPDHA